MRWTPAQLDAIEARDSNLLVSAAAGSGKTAVLTERILSLIKEGVQIQDILVVTFTKAAAAEMRARIMTALHEAAAEGGQHIALQALRVEYADITTLHGFCGQVCRNYFQAADVDPNYRVIDTAEGLILQEEAMNAALISCYTDNSPAFSYVAQAIPSQDALRDTILALYRFMLSRPDSWAWLDDAIAMHMLSIDELLASDWMQTLMAQIVRYTEEGEAAASRFLAYAREVDVCMEYAVEMHRQARACHAAACVGYDAYIAAGGIKMPFQLRFPKKPPVPDAIKEQMKALRDEVITVHKKIDDFAAGMQPLSTRLEDEQQFAVFLTGIQEAVSRYHHAYQLEKDKRNVLDYFDLEHKALHALSEPAVAAAVRHKYSHIFIDEYQDSSLLQEAILYAIKRKDNLFMVGDVKQSIYGFRLAESALFLEKLHSFHVDRDAVDRKISLNTNFRSRKSVIDAINPVFDRVFTGDTMEITYPAEERLYVGRNDLPVGAKAELHIVIPATGDASDADEAGDAVELSPEAKLAVRQEAEVIAARIIALQNDAEASYSFRDMVVLLRSPRGRVQHFVDVFQSHGIPAWSDLGEDVLSRIEIQEMLAILKVIDNMRQDIPLLAALRGPALGLSDEDLSFIRIAQPEGTFAGAMLAYAERDNPLAASLRDFVERIRGWSLDAQVLSLDKLIRQIYLETGFYADEGAKPDGAIRQANLRALSEQAFAFQARQYGNLSAFLRYLKRIQTGDGWDAPEISASDNVVRIMSIHKSKGLQFPVVIVAGTGSSLTTHHASMLQFNNKLGIGGMLIDPALRTKRKTISGLAVSEKNRQESIAEEARILYVAMTRAESRLIVVGRTKKQAMQQLDDVNIPVMMAKSMLEWIYPVALSSESWTTFVHDSFIPPADVQSSRKTVSIAEMLRATVPLSMDNPIHKSLGWMPDACSTSPIKQSVSSIVHAQVKIGERDDFPVSLVSSLASRPLFMEQKGLTATERGDAIHAFLQHVSLDAGDVKVACDDLVARGILSVAQVKVIPIDKMRRVLASDIWKRMKNAHIVHRELPFNLRVSREGGVGLMQGIIDCCFVEDEGWILVDYKSDRVTDADVLISQYRPQLLLYADALEKMTGMPVRERILFFLDIGEEYAV